MLAQTAPVSDRVGSTVRHDRFAIEPVLPTQGLQGPVNCARFPLSRGCCFNCGFSLPSCPSSSFGCGRGCEPLCHLKQLTSCRSTEVSSALAVSAVAGGSELVASGRRLVPVLPGVQLHDSPVAKSKTSLEEPAGSRGSLVVISADGAGTVPDSVESASCGSPTGTVFPGALCSASSVAGSGARSRQRGLSSGTVFPGASVVPAPGLLAPLQRVPRVAKRKRSVASLSPFDGAVKRRDAAVPVLPRRRTAVYR